MMSEERIEILRKDVIEDKKKIVGLKKDIKDAKGTEASKIQQSAQESIKNLTKGLQEKETELDSLTLPEANEEEVLQMIEIAATSEEVGEIEGSFEGEIPQNIQEAIEDRRQELSAGPKNLRQYPELRWKKTSLEEVMEVQKEDMELPPGKQHLARLVGHDEKKGIALIKPKRK